MGSEFSCEHLEDAQHKRRDNPECFFVTYKIKETSDFEGIKKTTETYPEFRGKVFAL